MWTCSIPGRRRADPGPWPKRPVYPVIRTGEGVCHIYVDEEADLDMAAKVLFNAKCSRPSVCNAVECVLVQRDVAADFWKKALPLLDEKGVELRADEEALALLGPRALPAAESDWDAEYDDYILAIRTVGGMDEAIRFINAHGTGHSEAIITEKTTSRPSTSWTKWTRRRCTSTPPPASPTAASSALAPKSASPPRRCTPGAPWGWRN